MKLDELLYSTGEWLKGTGPNVDIVLSSRVRLARNLDKLPFPNWASKKKLEEILDAVKKAVEKSSFPKNSLFLYMNNLSDLDRIFLVERHLISREHAVKGDGKALLIDDRETISLMINEEDHLRLQAMQSGLNLSDSMKIIDKIDTEISSQLNIAFSSKFGYLTACPTNTGTGMRASVMMHLPALVMTNQIGKIFQALAKLNFAVRGFYGEGTEAVGNFFQMSNQSTLGRPESDVIDNLEKIVKQIIVREKSARDILFTKSRELISDRIFRAYGTLKSARIITSEEAVRLLSDVKLGVDMELTKNIDLKMINEILILSQPAHLQKLEGKILSSVERDVKRSDLIREKLK